MTENIDFSNPKYFQEFYSNYYRALVQHGMRFVESQAVAEDIVQDIFTTVWFKAQSFSSITQLKVYLYNAVRNNCLEQLRHHNVEESYIEKVKVENPVYSFDDDDNEGAFGEEIYRRLFDAIEQLPGRQREILLMAMEGKPNRDIAKALDISTETVKTHKRRAKDILKHNLSPEAWLLLVLLSGME